MPPLAELNTTCPSELLNVREVSKLLGCSQRHIYRLTDAGKMPRPVKLGALVRWRKTELTKWLETGCPPIDQTEFEHVPIEGVDQDFPR